LNRLLVHEIDILYVLGGDGSMRAAHELGDLAKRTITDPSKRPSIVGVPKTSGSLLTLA
jgi:6-phosphofructokinase